MDRIHLPGGLSLFQLVFSAILPGFSFFALRQRLLGAVTLAVYVTTTAVFVMLLGHEASAVCFGLMISIHVTSIVYLQSHLLRGCCRFGYRMVVAVGTLVAAWLLVYWPVIGFVERHWFTPLRIGDQVVVVSRSANPESLKRGDWVAFRIDNRGVHGVYLRAGFVMSPVLAASGDRVEFCTNGFKVNGVLQRSLRSMPVAGELVVPEKHWYVWPEFAITVPHGNANGIDITGVLLQMATVSQEQFVGKPFKWWFWRRQTLQPPS